MDDIEITVFDEINDYKEKIYFFNFRQWVFAIIIVVLVVPTYLLLKDRIGEDITSYIVIAIAGVFGFIGFVKIHELPAEKILPYWFRHYFLFAKPIHYITDEEYKIMHQKKRRIKNSNNESLNKLSKSEIKELKKHQKQAKLLEKAKKKYGISTDKIGNKKVIEKKENKIKNEIQENEFLDKISKLTKEEQEVLLKMLGDGEK